MSNEYNKPDATLIRLALKNQTTAELTSSLDKCEIGISNDEGKLLFKDKDGVLHTANDGGAPSGAAGGDLTGTYPNPTISSKKVTAAKIADATITDAQIAAANKDGAVGTASMRTLGTGANQAAAGNDSRLSDSRTPTAHATTHSSGNSDAVTVSNLSGNLTQARSHDSADTDAGTTSLHHTLGTGANQAAAGDHPHSIYLQKPQLWYGKNIAFSVSLSTTPLILPVTGVFSSASGLENAIDGSVHPITPVANKWYKITYKVTMRQSLAKTINFAIKMNNTLHEDSVLNPCGPAPNHLCTTGFLFIETDIAFSYDDHISIVGYAEGTETKTIDYFEWSVEAYDGMV